MITLYRGSEAAFPTRAASADLIAVGRSSKKPSNRPDKWASTGSGRQS